MKHLKKFNESETEKLDIQFFKNIFAEFIDNPNNYIDYTKINDKYFYIVIEMPIIPYPIDVHWVSIPTIDDILTPFNNSSNILEDIKVAILQIKDEYPDLKPKISYLSDGKLKIFISYQIKQFNETFKTI